MSIPVRLWRWVDERLRLSHLLKASATHGLNPLYSLGGLAFLFFSILAVTGLVLATYYSPTPDTAYDSVQAISTSLQYGWLIRSVHFYAANCLILTAIVHLSNSYFKRTYRKPMELNWVVGVLLGAIALLSGFTGYVLRWDQQAVGAAGIGRGLAVSIPEAGADFMRLLWGQTEVDVAHRFFTTHTLLLPGLFASVLAVHFFLVRKHPVEVLMGELIAPLIIGSLLVFSSVFPVALGTKYDPMNPPTVLQPEWFFMGLYQFIKTQNVQPLHGVLITAALGVFFVSVPFIDRILQRHALRSALLNEAALFIIVEFVGLTIYGYLSPGKVGTFADLHFAEAFTITNLVALGSMALVFAWSRRRPVQHERPSVSNFHPERISEGRVSLAIGLVLLECFLVYEAFLADMNSSQRAFGVLVGLVFLCLAALLQVASPLLPKNGVAFQGPAQRVRSVA